MRDDQNHGSIANSKTFLIDRTKGQYCDRSVTVCQEIWIGSLISLLASFTHASTIGFCQRIYERLLHIDVRWCSKGKRSTWSGTLSNDDALLFDVHMSTSDKSYLCNICEKTFSQKRLVRHHILSNVHKSRDSDKNVMCDLWVR